MLTKDELKALTTTGRRMADLLAEQEKSGLSIGEFARRRGIPPTRLSWWRWEIRRRLEGCRQSRSDGPFVEAVVVAAQPSGARPAARLVLDVGRNRRVEVPADFDAATLRRLLEVLESC